MSVIAAKLDLILKDEDRRYIAKLAHFLETPQGIPVYFVPLESGDVGKTDFRSIWITSRTDEFSMERRQVALIHEFIHVFCYRNGLLRKWSHSFTHSLAYNLVVLSVCDDRLCCKC